jgi:hypothetical protein
MNDLELMPLRFFVAECHMEVLSSVLTRQAGGFERDPGIRRGRPIGTPHVCRHDISARFRV